MKLLNNGPTEEMKEIIEKALKKYNEETENKKEEIKKLNNILKNSNSLKRSIYESIEKTGDPSILEKLQEGIEGKDIVEKILKLQKNMPKSVLNSQELEKIKELKQLQIDEIMLKVKEVSDLALKIISDTKEVDELLEVVKQKEKVNDQ